MIKSVSCCAAQSVVTNEGPHSNNTSSDFALEASFSILIESRIDKDKDDFFADEVLLLTKKVTRKIVYTAAQMFPDFIQRQFATVSTRLECVILRNVSFDTVSQQR